MSGRNPTDLTRCAPPEADTILEKRSSYDIAKNSIVSVMLRLLEYHDGAVFLTTNRIQHFDPAVLSRVTISIAFTELSPAERERVWHLLLSSSGVDESRIQVRQIAHRYAMNGRSIKNALRLAMALAADLRSPLSHDLLVRVIGAVLKGMRGAGDQGEANDGPGPGAGVVGDTHTGHEHYASEIPGKMLSLTLDFGTVWSMGLGAVVAGIAIGMVIQREISKASVS